MPPMSPKITLGKEKKNVEQRRERKKEKKKSNGCTLSFYVEFFEDRRNCLMREIYFWLKSYVIVQESN